MTEAEAIRRNNSRFDLRLQYYLTRVAGDYIWHYPSMPCSCSSDSHRGRPDCLVCFGTGRAYDAPRRVAGLLTMANQNKDLLMTGVALVGDMVFSPDVHDINFGDMDMAVAEYGGGNAWDGEIIIRRGDTALLTYPVKKIVAVVQHRPQSGQKIAYTEGVDFTVSGRILTWLAGRGPEPATFVSVRYKAQFEWLIFVPPANRVERGTALGYRIILRLRHLAKTEPPTIS